MPEAAAQANAPTPQEQILGIVNTYWQSCCVGAAVQMELADLLANGPLDVEVLAERTRTHALSLYRMLRALESTGIFAQSSPRVFANTPLSECLCRHTVFDGWPGRAQALQNGHPALTSYAVIPCSCAGSVNVD